MTYPFRKVSLISSDAAGTTVHLLKSDEKVAAMLSLGYRIYHEWEVVSPTEIREIFKSPI